MPKFHYFSKVALKVFNFAVEGAVSEKQPDLFCVS